MFISREFYWSVVPILNFVVWFLFGRQEYPHNYFSFEICPIIPAIIIPPPPCTNKSDTNKLKSALVEKQAVPICGTLFTRPAPKLILVNPQNLSEYRSQNLVKMKYPGTALVINLYDERTSCQSFVNPTLGLLKTCLAIVHSNVPAAHNLLRYDSDPNIRHPMLTSKTGNVFPTGFFKVRYVFMIGYFPLR